MADHETEHTDDISEYDIARLLQPALALIVEIGWDRARTVLPAMLAAAIAERDRRRKREEAA